MKSGTVTDMVSPMWTTADVGHIHGAYRATTNTVTPSEENTWKQSEDIPNEQHVPNPQSRNESQGGGSLSQLSGLNTDSLKLLLQFIEEKSGKALPVSKSGEGDTAETSDQIEPDNQVSSTSIDTGKVSRNSRDIPRSDRSTDSSTVKRKEKNAKQKDNSNQCKNTAEKNKHEIQDKKANKRFIASNAKRKPRLSKIAANRRLSEYASEGGDISDSSMDNTETVKRSRKSGYYVHSSEESNDSSDGEQNIREKHPRRCTENRVPKYDKPSSSDSGSSIDNVDEQSKPGPTKIKGKGKLKKRSSSIHQRHLSEDSSNQEQNNDQKERSYRRIVSNNDLSSSDSDSLTDSEGQQRKPGTRIRNKGKLYRKASSDVKTVSKHGYTIRDQSEKIPPKDKCVRRKSGNRKEKDSKAETVQITSPSAEKQTRKTPIDKTDIFGIRKRRSNSLKVTADKPEDGDSESKGFCADEKKKIKKQGPMSDSDKPSPDVIGGKEKATIQNTEKLLSKCNESPITPKQERIDSAASTSNESKVASTITGKKLKVNIQKLSSVEVSLDKLSTKAVSPKQTSSKEKPPKAESTSLKQKPTSPKQESTLPKEAVSANAQYKVYCYRFILAFN